TTGGAAVGSVCAMSRYSKQTFRSCEERDVGCRPSEIRGLDDARRAANALDLMGDRYTPIIVRVLILRPNRFADLHKAVRGISRQDPDLLQGCCHHPS
ncbi:MAG TPA: hypothetical protein VFI46_18120, partial [Jiangellaceae bacterium]|nr:hypothetical protein [Jiangellaceae bacterium]